jgi:hypothetical protein
MEENYIDLIKEHIELDKLLSTTDPKYHPKIKKLLKKKKAIINKNGFFAEFQLNKINKKIQKLKK